MNDDRTLTRIGDPDCWPDTVPAPPYLHLLFGQGEQHNSCRMHVVSADAVRIAVPAFLMHSFLCPGETGEAETMEAAAPSSPPADPPTARMTVKQLRAALRDHGLGTQGLKAELVERLETATGTPPHAAGMVAEVGDNFPMARLAAAAEVTKELEVLSTEVRAVRPPGPATAPPPLARTCACRGPRAVAVRPSAFGERPCAPARPGTRP